MFGNYGGDVTFERTDCPECRSRGSVERATCQICLAELDETPLPLDDIAGAEPVDAPSVAFGRTAVMHS